MPMTAMSTAATTAIRPSLRSRAGEGPCRSAVVGGCGGGASRCMSFTVASAPSVRDRSRIRGRRRLVLLVSVQDAEHDRYEEQRRHGGDRQTADDRTTERCVLLAALAERERH